MEMINVVAINEMGHFILFTKPSNKEIDYYLCDNGIYDIIRPYISDYFIRHKDGNFTCHYKLNKHVTEHMFIKVGKYIVNMDFSQLN
jgi:hypothetical protein